MECIAYGKYSACSNCSSTDSLRDKAEKIKKEIDIMFGLRELTKVWEPCNIYDSAIIGHGGSIGMFTEIGPNVTIGDRVRIGKGCFIPEGITIGDDCFIGPHVCFSNDMYPPGVREDWQRTYILNGASIGANVSIRPGVTIGRNSLVGMGAVVTCDIPDNEVWAGVPAIMIRNNYKLKEGVEND